MSGPPREIFTGYDGHSIYALPLYVQATWHYSSHEHVGQVEGGNSMQEETLRQHVNSKMRHWPFSSPFYNFLLAVYEARPENEA